MSIAEPFDDAASCIAEPFDDAASCIAEQFDDAASSIVEPFDDDELSIAETSDAIPSVIDIDNVPSYKVSRPHHRTHRQY